MRAADPLIERGGHVYPSKQPIGAIPVALGADPLIERLHQGGSLVVVEPVVLTNLGLDRMQVHDLALGQVGGLV